MAMAEPDPEDIMTKLQTLVSWVQSNTGTAASTAFSQLTGSTAFEEPSVQDLYVTYKQEYMNLLTDYLQMQKDSTAKSKPDQDDLKEQLAHSDAAAASASISLDTYKRGTIALAVMTAGFVLLVFVLAILRYYYVPGWIRGVVGSIAAVASIGAGLVAYFQADL
jgi:hypothetical protein